MNSKLCSKSTIAFRVFNDGKGAPPLIYIHGAMGQKEVWNLVLRPLSDMLTEIEHYIIDLVGHGQSGGEGFSRIEDYTDSIVAFIDKGIFVGHSMGGAISQDMAIRNPEKVERLCLIGTGARLGVSQGILQAIEADFDMAVSMVKDFIFGPDTPKKIINPVIQQMRGIGAKTALFDFIACNSFDAVGKIDQFNGAAIVCCGSKDFMTPTEKNQKLANALGCRFVEFENAGHMLQLEKPNELAKAIAQFIQD